MMRRLGLRGLTAGLQAQDSPGWFLQSYEQPDCSQYGNVLSGYVQIIAKRTLRLFWEENPRAEIPLQTWFVLVSAAAWTGPAAV